jgi:hypothetical protein
MKKGFKKNYLRQTPIELADGKEYIFTALPFTPKVIALLQAIDGNAEAWASMETLMKMTRLSLGYNYTEEQIDELFECGLICFENQKLLMGALVYQAAKEAPEDSEGQDES